MEYIRGTKIFRTKILVTGTSLEVITYKFYFLQLDADIVPCGSGSAPEL